MRMDFIPFFADLKGVVVYGDAAGNLGFCILSLHFGICGYIAENATFLFSKKTSMVPGNLNFPSLESWIWTSKEEILKPLGLIGRKDKSTKESKCFM